MHRKPLSKAIALVALVGFICLFAPGLSSAEKRTSRFDFRSVLSKPVVWVSSLWGWIAPVFGSAGAPASKNIAPDNSPLKVRPTGGLAAPRMGGGD